MKYFITIMAFLFCFNVFAAPRELGFDIAVFNSITAEPTAPAVNKYKLFIHSGELKFQSNSFIGIVPLKNRANVYTQQQTIQMQTIASGATADLDNGNQVSFLAPGGAAITLNNAIDGGVYNVFVTDGTARTYTFTINKKETGALIVRCSPVLTATTAAKHASFSFTRVGNNAYCFWTGGL